MSFKLRVNFKGLCLFDPDALRPHKTMDVLVLDARNPRGRLPHRPHVPRLSFDYERLVSKTVPEGADVCVLSDIDKSKFSELKGTPLEIAYLMNDDEFAIQDKDGRPITEMGGSLEIEGEGLPIPVPLPDEPSSAERQHFHWLPHMSALYGAADKPVLPTRPKHTPVGKLTLAAGTIGTSKLFVSEGNLVRMKFDDMDKDGELREVATSVEQWMAEVVSFETGRIFEDEVRIVSSRFRQEPIRLAPKHGHHVVEVTIENNPLENVTEDPRDFELVYMPLAMKRNTKKKIPRRTDLFASFPCSGGCTC